MCVRRTMVIMERRPKKRNMEAKAHNKNAIHVQSTLIACPAYGHPRNMDAEVIDGNILLKF